MAHNKVKDTFFSKNLGLNCAGKLMDLSVPRIMGILNITPDSFSDGGKYLQPDAAVNQMHTMLEQGAEIIDIGASSSRPGAEDLTPEEELKRLRPVMDKIRKVFPEVILSIDTAMAEVAESMIRDYRVNIINDITAGNRDPELIDLVAKMNVPYIIMHMQGTPRNMQKDPIYENVMDEIIRFFSEKVYLLRKKGVNDILLDPGFGFGKNLEHNYTIAGNFSSFQLFELPLVAGISRKSVISKLIHKPTADTLNGTTALHMLLLERGANILRVHDVEAAREAITIYRETKKYEH